MYLHTRLLFDRNSDAAALVVSVLVPLESIRGDVAR